MNTDQTLLSNWNTQSDELEQVDFTYDEHIMLKGIALTEFEFGASTRLRHTEGAGQPEFGIQLQYAPQEKLQIQFSKHDENWKLAVTSEGLAPVINRVLALPASFQAEQWHTLHIVQQKEQIHLYLNNDYVLAISEQARTAQPGLVTHNAAADFMNIKQIDLLSETIIN